MPFCGELKKQGKETEAVESLLTKHVAVKGRREKIASLLVRGPWSNTHTYLTNSEKIAMEDTRGTIRTKLNMSSMLDNSIMSTFNFLFLGDTC